VLVRTKDASTMGPELRCQHARYRLARMACIVGVDIIISENRITIESAESSGLEQ
jgi:hypothetical protein